MTLIVNSRFVTDRWSWVTREDASSLVWCPTMNFRKF
jgi:hypothetical protein